MAAQVTFSIGVFANKLISINESQQSIQTLSQWMVFHRNNIEAMVEVWKNEFQRAKVDHKKQLVYLYLANDVMQTCMRKYGSQISDAFSVYLKLCIADMLRYHYRLVIRQVEKVLQVWKDRKVLRSELLNEISLLVTETLVSGDSIQVVPQVSRPLPVIPSSQIYEPLIEADDKPHIEFFFNLDDVTDSTETAKISLELRNLESSVVNSNLLSTNCFKFYTLLKRFENARNKEVDQKENFDLLPLEQNRSNIRWKEFTLDLFDLDITTVHESTEKFRLALDSQMSNREIVLNSLTELCDYKIPIEENSESIGEIEDKICSLEEICETVRLGQKQERKRQRQEELRLQEEAEAKRKADEEAASFLREVNASMKKSMEDEPSYKKSKFQWSHEEHSPSQEQPHYGYEDRRNDMIYSNNNNYHSNTNNRQRRSSDYGSSEHRRGNRNSNNNSFNRDNFSRRASSSSFKRNTHNSSNYSSYHSNESDQHSSYNSKQEKSWNSNQFSGRKRGKKRF